MQRLRRLVQRRSTRQAERCFVAEGTKILAAALDAGAPVEGIYYDPAALGQPRAAALLERARVAGTRVFALREGVMGRVADTVTPQPVCAVVGFVDIALEQLAGEHRACGQLVVGQPAGRQPAAGEPAAAAICVCVDVRDPGNLGALVRVADAAGAGAVVACAGSADLYSPKTVRASAGSLFHLPVVTGGEPAAVLAQLAAAGYRRLGTVAGRGSDYATEDLSGKIALVFGNEANGLDDVLEPLLDGLLTVPMAGQAESLNVAMTATVLCFEIARRRRVDGGSPLLR